MVPENDDTGQHFRIFELGVISAKPMNANQLHLAREIAPKHASVVCVHEGGRNEPSSNSALSHPGMRQQHEIDVQACSGIDRIAMDYGRTLPKLELVFRLDCLVAQVRRVG